MSILSERIKAALLPAKLITFLAGKLAECRIGLIKNTFIRLFINRYKVNMQEAIFQQAESYTHFNDFFTRHLKPGIRPIDDAEMICPVDGVLSIAEDIKQQQLIQAKGIHYSVQALLADSEKAPLFSDGYAATFYLAPKDYHRIHAPIDITVTGMTYVPGQLFSVNPKTAEAIPNLFARNQRLIVSCETTQGPMMMVLVGATIVGAIGTSWHGDIKQTGKIQQWHYKEPFALAKGEELGYFKLGSTVILLINQKLKHHLKLSEHHSKKVCIGEKL